MRVAELTGSRLDYWVQCAYTKDDPEFSFRHTDLQNGKFNDEAWGYELAWGRGWCDPSVNWEQGGPIIERDKIWIAYIAGGLWCAAIGSMACLQGLELEGDHYQTGPTPLIAAMRSKVASVYGENVPDEVKP